MCQKRDELHRVSNEFYTFGLIVRKGRVIKAPPIAKWTKGKELKWVIDYYQNKKGCTVKRIA